LISVPAITVTGLSFSYGARAVLENLSFEVGEGEFVGLIGPNSAGKSTLLRLLSRLRRPSKGAITLKAKSLEDWSLQELAKTMAVVSSEDYFAFPFSVGQIVLLGRTPYLSRGRWERPEDYAAAQKAMQVTDVLHLADRSIQQLSSGERQRVLLARALAQEPKVLLLDEPTAHLDLGHQWAFFDLLDRLHREQGVTIISAIHDLSLAARYADKLILLHQGCLHSQGSPKQTLMAEAVREVFGVSVEARWSDHGQNLFLCPSQNQERE
jgi:iron complex transport system ATP-binding protein